LLRKTRDEGLGIWEEISLGGEKMLIRGGGRIPFCKNLVTAGGGGRCTHSRTRRDGSQLCKSCDRADRRKGPLPFKALRMIELGAYSFCLVGKGGGFKASLKQNRSTYRRKVSISLLNGSEDWDWSKGLVSLSLEGDR